MMEVAALGVVVAPLGMVAPMGMRVVASQGYGGTHGNNAGAPLGMVSPMGMRLVALLGIVAPMG